MKGIRNMTGRTLVVSLEKDPIYSRAIHLQAGAAFTPPSNFEGFVTFLETE